MPKPEKHFLGNIKQSSIKVSIVINRWFHVNQDVRMEKRLRVYVQDLVMGLIETA